jgi:amino acid transporter
VLFQSITDMAPGAAIAASIPTGAALAGGSLPLSVLFALVACLFCAGCVGMLAREMPAAGSVATYAARGLHPAAGFLVAWGYVLVGVLIPPLVLLQLGFTTASTIHSEFAGYPANLWWPWALAGALIVLAAGYYGIRTSARLGTVLGIFEIAVFAVLAVFLIVHAGKHNTLSVFGTGYAPSPHRGISGVIAGSVYTVLAFGGFESAAPLAGEARDPRRTVPRAVIGATLGIGVLYVLTTYAADVAFGPKSFAGFGSSGAASWVGLSRTFYGLFWFFVFLAIVNSTIANANAGVNVSSRTAYAMGRIRALPHLLAFIHPRHRTPVTGILVAFGATVAVTLGLGLGYDPVTAFAMVGTGIVIVLVAIYILVDAACIGFFARAGTRRFNPLLHLVVPVLGIVTFVPAWLTAAGIKAFSFVTPLAAPVSYMGLGVAGWMIAGICYLLYLYARAPQRVTEVGLVHLDEAPTAGAEPAATDVKGRP